jgi:hypothetical protein
MISIFCLISWYRCWLTKCECRSIGWYSIILKESKRNERMNVYWAVCIMIGCVNLLWQNECLLISVCERDCAYVWVSVVGGCELVCVCECVRVSVCACISMAAHRFLCVAVFTYRNTSLLFLFVVFCCFFTEKLYSHCIMFGHLRTHLYYDIYYDILDASFLHVFLLITLWYEIGIIMFYIRLSCI